MTTPATLGAAAPPIVDLIVGPGTGTADRLVADLRAVRTPSGRFLVPAVTRQGAARSLLAYNRLRPWRTRLSRGAFAGLAWAGAGRLTAPPRQILAPADAPLLLDHLGAALGEPELVFATTEKAGRGFQTPMLQLFTPTGRCVGFAKVGWDPVTTRMIDNEAESLELVARAAPSGFRSPEVLWHGPWQNLVVLVTAPMPARARRLKPSMLPPIAPLRTVATLDGPLRREALGSSAYWQSARETAADAARSGDPALQHEVDAIEADLATTEIEFGRWHADWVEWNLAIAGDDLYVWDWAYSAADVPFGFDLLQFYFLRHRNLRAMPDDAALDLAAADAAAGLGEMGLDEAARDAVTRVHRIEFPLRWARAAQLRRDATAGHAEPRGA